MHMKILTGTHIFRKFRINWKSIEKVALHRKKVSDPTLYAMWSHPTSCKFLCFLVCLHYLTGKGNILWSVVLTRWLWEYFNILHQQGSSDIIDIATIANEGAAPANISWATLHLSNIMFLAQSFYYLGAHKYIFFKAALRPHYSYVTLQYLMTFCQKDLFEYTYFIQEDGQGRLIA